MPRSLEIRQCPRCDLRFTNRSEIDDHLSRDHEHVPIASEVTDESDVLGVGGPLSGRIVVPVDPSRPAPRAAQVAMTIARQASMSVELIAARPPGFDQFATQRCLHRWVRDIADVNLPVTCEDLGPGEPAEAILHYLETGGVSLLSMETRGRTVAGQFAFGSVTQGVIRRSPVPILLCGRHLQPAKRYSRIIVGIDGSRPAEEALRFATTFGRTIDATIELLEVVDPDVVLPPDVGETGYLHRLTASFRPAIEDFDTLRHRHPGLALAQAASEPETMLAVGFHGRSGFDRLRVGSVATDAVRHASCPVLVVPPTTP